MQFYLKQFAADYDCAAYGNGGYNTNTCATTNTSDGQLVQTGTNVAIGLTAGILLIVVAVVVLLKMRRKKHN